MNEDLNAYVEAMQFTNRTCGKANLSHLQGEWDELLHADSVDNFVEEVNDVLHAIARLAPFGMDCWLGFFLANKAAMKFVRRWKAYHHISSAKNMLKKYGIVVPDIH